MELKRVVVTGLGVISPLGNTVESFWDNLGKGVSGCELITRFDISNYKTKFACQVKDFDPLKYIDKKEARKVDLYVQYAMASAADALTDSGINLAETDLDQIGCILGLGYRRN